jgi:hypothetical protein
MFERAKNMPSLDNVRKDWPCPSEPEHCSPPKAPHAVTGASGTMVATISRNNLDKDLVLKGRPPFAGREKPVVRGAAICAPHDEYRALMRLDARVEWRKV